MSDKAMSRETMDAREKLGEGRITKEKEVSVD